MQQFILLKKNSPIQSTATAAIPFSLQLAFDENGAYLLTMSNKGDEIVPEIAHTSDRMRDLLRAMSVIQQRNALKVDWQISGNHVYLHEHDYLLELAKHTGQLQLTDGDSVSFGDKTSFLELHLENSENHKQTQFQWHLQFQNGKDIARGAAIKFISERYILIKKTVHEILPLGENFKALPPFDTKISTEDIPNYLSLASSAFTNLRLQYQDYNVREGQAVDSLPAIVFEQVDPHEGLRLSVTSIVEGFSPKFFNDYDISKIVNINEMEKNLVVRKVNTRDSSEVSKKVAALLRKHKKSLPADSAGNFYQDGIFFIVEKELASIFLYKELAKLLETYILIGTEKLKSYKITTSKTPALSLRLNHGIDFLDGQGTLTVEDEDFNLLTILRQYRKKGFLTLSNGNNVILEKKYVDRLKRLFDHKNDKLRISFFDLPLVEELIDDKLSSSYLPKSRDIFTGFNTISKTRPTIPKINGTMREYQKYGYKWLRYLYKHSLGGCLADDMGLGKTLQAIVLLAAVAGKSKKTSLIIMPKTLLFNWARELEKFAPQLTFYTWYDKNRDMRDAKKHDLILTTYGLIRTNIQTFKKEAFNYLILDESQNIKNSKSQISKAVMLLNGEHRLALSGTPIENNLGELYSLFRFLNPAMFRSEREFASRYGNPIQQDNDKDAIHELRTKVYPFILRRLKQDVLKDLPDKMEQLLYVDMSKEQEQLYEERRIFYQTAIREQINQQGLNKSQFFILQALLELRQIASCPESKSDGVILSPKRELLLESIEEAVANGHKALVFSNFLNVIDSVCNDLKTSNIPHSFITGAIHNRQQIVDNFQSNSSMKVLVMTLKTGGVGLNLTAADRIFIFDPWWNLSAENQAIDRSHRIGQNRTVFCYKLLCRNTIEEKMIELQTKKKELLDSIISHDSSAVKKLSAADVDFMLS